METTCAQNTSLRIPVAEDRDTDGFLRVVNAMARTIGGTFAAVNVRLGRRTRVTPGMSDRSVARLAGGECYEDLVRWNALAYQYDCKGIMR